MPVICHFRDCTVLIAVSQNFSKQRCSMYHDFNLPLSNSECRGMSDEDDDDVISSYSDEFCTIFKAFTLQIKKTLD